MAHELQMVGAVQTIFTIFVALFFAFMPLVSDSKEGKDPYEDIEIPSKIAECVTSIPPLVDEIHGWALRHARISTDDLSRWKKNVKRAAILPRLQIGYERRIADAVRVAVDDTVSVTSSGSIIGPSASGWGQNLDRNHNIEVKAVWYLDELLFNNDELSVSEEVRSHVAARRELLGEVNDAYFKLKRLISMYLMNSLLVAPLKGRIRIEIERTIGQLDALSGGFFGKGFNWKGVRCE